MLLSSVPFPFLLRSSSVPPFPRSSHSFSLPSPPASPPLASVLSPFCLLYLLLFLFLYLLLLFFLFSLFFFPVFLAFPLFTCYIPSSISHPPLPLSYPSLLLSPPPSDSLLIGAAFSSCFFPFLFFMFLFCGGSRVVGGLCCAISFDLPASLIPPPLPPPPLPSPALLLSELCTLFRAFFIFPSIIFAGERPAHTNIPYTTSLSWRAARPPGPSVNLISFFSLISISALQPQQPIDTTPPILLHHPWPPYHPLCLSLFSLGIIPPNPPPLFCVSSLIGRAPLPYAPFSVFSAPLWPYFNFPLIFLFPFTKETKKQKKSKGGEGPGSFKSRGS